MSAPVVPRRSRRAATVDGLAAAAVEEIRHTGYDGLTVRNVARRAGVAPATAYIHFASKDHLVAEAFWRLLDALPEIDVDRRQAVPVRVAAAIADVARLVTEEPAVAAAATSAMFANDPEVARLRRRVGAAFRQRFTAALGDDADEAALEALDLAFSGAMVRAGVGEMAYADLGSLMAAVAEVVTVSRVVGPPSVSARAAPRSQGRRRRQGGGPGEEEDTATVVQTRRDGGMSGDSGDSRV